MRLLQDEGSAARSVVAGRAAYFYMKRGMDLVLTPLMLLVLLPFLCGIAVLIKLDSKGPILFVQERVGARRRRVDGQAVWERANFRFYKFRSMAPGADQSLHQQYIRGVRGSAFRHHARREADR